MGQDGPTRRARVWRRLQAGSHAWGCKWDYTLRVWRRLQAVARMLRRDLASLDSLLIYNLFAAYTPTWSGFGSAIAMLVRACGSAPLYLYRPWLQSRPIDTEPAGPALRPVAHIGAGTAHSACRAALCALGA